MVKDPKKNPAADRHHGGPGSSHEDARQHENQHAGAHQPPTPGTPTNPDRSRVSGGGGERDRHHTHDNQRK